MHSTDTDTGSPTNAPRSLSERVITAIVDAKGQSPNDLEPLYNAIDPEALDALFAPQADGTTRARGSVSFQYAGYWITVSSENAVEFKADDP
nr:HalOD1 output domain-containing protein [Haladaptatus halobius]